MFSLSMKIDGDAFEREADAYVDTDLNGGLIDAVNRVADMARDALVEAMPIYLDRPNPFSTAAWKVIHAKTTPEAIVFAQPLQAQYLTYVVDGGVRRAGDYATTARGPLVPGKDAVLDQYGNLPRDFVTSALQDPNVAWATITPGKPPALIRHAPGRDVEILALIVDEAVSNPRSRTVRSISNSPAAMASSMKVSSFARTLGAHPLFMTTRLSASTRAARCASFRPGRTTTGTRASPRRLAASSLPWPAMMVSCSSTMSGTRKPKVEMRPMSWAICSSGCVRALRSYPRRVRTSTRWVSAYRSGSSVRTGNPLRRMEVRGVRTPRISVCLAPPRAQVTSGIRSLGKDP
ncbi:hypothetical protein AU375_03993 [Methylobacterium radiotolerans]|nr:hypothetical protein AU375_03993 [Methylobacterium radiotolerans]